MTDNQPPPSWPGDEPMRPGGQPPQPYGQPSPTYQAPMYQAPAYPGAGGPRGGGGKSGSGRPGALTAAAVLTHIGAAVVLAAGLLMLLALLSTAILRDAAASGEFGEMSLGETRILFGCLGAGFLIYGVALIVLAVHAARGRNGVRIALTVLGGAFAVLFSLSVLSSLWVLVPVLYVVLAVLLLWVGGSNAWCRAQKAARRAANAVPPAPPIG